MARPRTNHAAKRNELIKTAFALFMEKGYEDTSIQDIMDAAKISKGAMYHYFACKEDVLDAVLNYIIDLDTKRFEPVFEDKSLSSLDKLMLSMNFSCNPQSEAVTQATEYIIQRKDSIFDYRARELSRERTLPKLTELIKEGISSGEFHTDYPEEMAVFIYMSSQPMADMIMKQSDTSALLRASEAFILLLSNCLGLEKKEHDLLINHFRDNLKV